MYCVLFRDPGLLDVCFQTLCFRDAVVGMLLCDVVGCCCWEFVCDNNIVDAIAMLRSLLAAYYLYLFVSHVTRRRVFRAGRRQNTIDD